MQHPDTVVVEGRRGEDGRRRAAAPAARTSAVQIIAIASGIVTVRIAAIAIAVIVVAVVVVVGVAVTVAIVVVEHVGRERYANNMSGMRMLLRRRRRLPDGREIRGHIADDRVQLLRRIDAYLGSACIVRR